MGTFLEGNGGEGGVTKGVMGLLFLDAREWLGFLIEIGMCRKIFQLFNFVICEACTLLVNEVFDHEHA